LRFCGLKGLFGRYWLLRRRRLGRCRGGGLSLRRPKLRHRSRRLVGRPKLRADGLRRVPGSRSPDHFTPQTCGEPVFGLQNAAVLLGERVRERWTGGEAALDDDLTQAQTRPRLLLESLSELVLGEQSRRNEDSAELRCWKLGRVHDSSIGAYAGFLRTRSGIRPEGETRPVIGEELRRLSTWGERHRRLLARLTIALILTLVVDMIGAVLEWYFEHGVRGGDIHDFGDAMFFSTVQLLTVSSQIKNPLTAAGRIVDVFLEVWALFVVTTIAGSFAAFFGSADL
jgi:hypothetical protein